MVKIFVLNNFRINDEIGSIKALNKIDKLLFGIPSPTLYFLTPDSKQKPRLLLTPVLCHANPVNPSAAPDAAAMAVQVYPEQLYQVFVERVSRKDGTKFAGLFLNWEVCFGLGCFRAGQPMKKPETLKQLVCCWPFFQDHRHQPTLVLFYDVHNILEKYV